MMNLSLSDNEKIVLTATIREELNFLQNQLESTENDLLLLKILLKKIENGDT